jgi:hypothetical protein
MLDGVGMTLLCVQILLQIAISSAGRHPVTVVGIESVTRRTLFAMFSNADRRAGRGRGVLFMGIYMPAASLDTVTQNATRKWHHHAVVDPAFILKGAYRQSRAGRICIRHRTPGCIAYPAAWRANVFGLRVVRAMAGCRRHLFRLAVRA